MYRDHEGSDQRNETEGKPVKAVVYVRVSTEEQTKNLSLETQRRECERFCQRSG